MLDVNEAYTRCNSLHAANISKRFGSSSPLMRHVLPSHSNGFDMQQYFVELPLETMLIISSIR